jgi:hypothetical protein
MKEDKKEVKDIEVNEPKVLKPRKAKKVVKWTFKNDLGTHENGEIRFKKGQSYELTKKQIENFKKHNLICQI